MSVSISKLIHRRIGRRDLLKLGGVGVMASACIRQPISIATTDKSAFGFKNLKATYDETHHVAEGYECRVLLAWGDPIFLNQKPFHIHDLTDETQRYRFGYNNDYIAFIEMDKETAVLVINNEATIAGLMFENESGYSAQQERNIAVEMTAHGLTIVGLKEINGIWEIDLSSPVNRRITAHTPMRIAGPAAGSERLKTPNDPTGKTVKGTLHNCSGGVTPWGNVLTCEENILYYFNGDISGTSQEQAFKRYKIGRVTGYRWDKIDPRFSLSVAENEPNRFGWVVEIDPRNPSGVPIKRTALGRFNHESANPIVNGDGRIVIYMGDDGAFEYLYRYVSHGRYSVNEDSSTLLDNGTLFVAIFKDEGDLIWKPLVFGEGPLTQENGFESQAHILIHARLAADALGATPMDRVEDVEPHPNNGTVFVNLTGVSDRGEAGKPTIDPANPRRSNLNGHVITLHAPNDKGYFDHAANTMKWDILLMAGDVSDSDVLAQYDRHNQSPANFGRPDNSAIDPSGRLWITTDGSEKTIGICDGLYAIDTHGALKGQAKRLFSAPMGAEVTGPCFTPDGKTLFLSVQHPGHTKNATYTSPGTRWPDFDEDLPPRPAVIQIRRKDGGVIGD